MSFRIRTFEMSDYDAAIALWQRCDGVGLSDADRPEAIKFFLERNPGLSFVAEDEGQLAGTVLCGHDGRRGLIHHLATDPAQRRQGVGRALLTHALGALHAAGIHKCHLMVFRQNTGGMAFWHAVGAEERVKLSLFSLHTQPSEL